MSLIEELKELRFLEGFSQHNYVGTIDRAIAALEAADKLVDEYESFLWLSDDTLKSYKEARDVSAAGEESQS